MRKGFIKPSGAGYTFDSKAWSEAAAEGLDKKIKRRLELFDRPVTLSQLWLRIVDSDSIPYTEQEVHDRLIALKEAGDVILTKDGYALRKEEKD